MNRTVNKSIAAILLAIICAFMPISAAEAATEKTQRLVNEETMYVDGYIITVSVYEDDNANLATPLATTYEKSGKKHIPPQTIRVLYFLHSPCTVHLR